MTIELHKITQQFKTETLSEIEDHILNEIKNISPNITRGGRIAITAGSRGINQIPVIIKAIVRGVREMGGDPFIVPAMGSHGGATAEGQYNILKELGITEEFTGAPIISSMAVVEVAQININGQGFPVLVDKNAFEADGIIAVNRIKPHTSFHSQIESGIMKMIVIGLGKDKLAKTIHGFGVKGLKNFIIPSAREVLKTGKIIAGLGIIENAKDQVCQIKAFLPKDIEEGEIDLLKTARGKMPKLPVEDIDVLVVQEIGKNISGTGMDTNIIGRLRIEGESELPSPRIKKIIVLDLTPATRGNAYGIGLADFTTRKLFKKIDLKVTNKNAITSTFFERVKIPFVAKNEEEAFTLACRSLKVKNPEDLRVIRIKNTLELETLWISENLRKEINN